MPADFADRLEPGRYSDDPPVHLFRCDQIGPMDEGLWVPERIWERVRLLGAAYEAHLLPLLDGSTDPVFLNPEQCGTLESELRFVAERLDDPLVEGLVHGIISLLREKSDGTSKEMVGIEFP